jgi:hypothetical protein
MKKLMYFLVVISVCAFIYYNYSVGEAANEAVPTDTKGIVTDPFSLSITNCGDSLGSFNGVTAYYNSGGINSCGNRHWSSDGAYSFGFKWQCVEFIRRYYYEALNYKMPNRWGNASDYFIENIPSGSMNTERGLVQYHNGNIMPQINDLLIFQNMAGGLGHVSIVTNVTDSRISTIAQNIGMRCENSLSLDGNQIGGGCSGFLRKESID